MGSKDLSVFLHIDLDAFFASVEQLDNPEYRGKPVIVGGLPGDRRSVVSTCSYEARKYGVHSAMPMVKAVQLCPHAIFLRGRMDRYHEKSREVMAIFNDYSPDVQQISVDEAFIDISGTERLFGPPEQLAQTIQDRVQNQTGLTVSLGLASNKYIAKIASGMSKPHGLYCVKPGDEEAFMLQLPLKKVWGIGGKTLERLNSKGFFTTADIHKASENLLISLFGAATGSFLYKAVRGTEVEIFNTQAKSHSISSEQTYSFDLTDSYIIDTALMQLSYEVMFRLLNEKWYTKTIQVKIRYEDFATITVQHTGQRTLATAEQIFQQVKELFYKKWETGRGIRLLGVAAQNLNKTASDEQAELFDIDDSRKKKVEQTVLQLQQKNPKLKLKKARLLGLLCFLLAAFCTENTIEAQRVSTALLPPLPFLGPEAPASLFDYSINDENVEFFTSGFWEASLKSDTSLTFGGKDPAKLTFSPIVFAQKADLTVWFLLNKKWYFEASFADGYDSNSVAAGYIGTETVKHVRVGNQGIYFPQDYSGTSVDASGNVGGGKNMAPGIMAQLSGERWRSDFLLRYDSAEYKEKIFSGSSEISSASIDLKNWDRGNRFVLPNSTTAASIQGVYVEIPDGSPSGQSSAQKITDSSGRSYRKLGSEEYQVQLLQGLLLLDKKHSGRILITFSHNQSEVQTALGTWSDSSSFLGATKQLFNLDVENFSHKTAVDFFTSLSGTELGTAQALILQDAPFFSPFIVASTYTTTSTTIEEAYIQHRSTAALYPGYKVLISKDNTVFVNHDVSKPVYMMAQVYKANQEENLPANHPLHRFPLAAEFPFMYLNTQDVQKADLVLQTKTRQTVKDYTIGSKVIPGTITVYRNGMVEKGFTFNQQQGTIFLLSPVNDFEKIRITWMESGLYKSNNSIAGAAGYQLQILDSLHFDTSFTTRWVVTDKKFDDSTNSSQGNATLNAGIQWEDYGFTIKNTLTGAVDVLNLTGTYRILGFGENLANTVYLQSSAAVASVTVPALPSSFAVSLDLNKQGANKGNKTVQDSQVSGYAVLLDWDMSSAISDTATATAPFWISQTVDLGKNAAALPSAKKFSLALKTLDTAVTNYEVYLQLGVSTNARNMEDQGAVRTWKITSSSLADKVEAAFDKSKPGMQTITVLLDDADRAALTRHQNLRIVVTSPNKTGDNTSGATGKLHIGPYEIVGTSFAVESEQGALISAEDKKNSFAPLPPEAQKFTGNAPNSILHLSWAQTAQPFSIYRFIPDVPLGSYKKLHFYLLIPQTALTADIVVVLQRQTETGQQEALRLTLAKDYLNGLAASAWHKVSIDLSSNAVFLNGQKLEVSQAQLQTDLSIAPTQLRIQVSPQDLSVTKGDIIFDEFYLESTSPQYRVQDSLEFQWAKTGTLWSAGKLPLFANPLFYIRATGAGAFQEQQQNNFDFSGEAKTQFTLAGIDLGGSISRITGEREIFSTASHSIAARPPALDVSEKYFFTTPGNNSQKENTLKLYIPKIPFEISDTIKAQAERSYLTSKQKISSTTNISFPIAKARYSFEGTLNASQQLEHKSLYRNTDHMNYGTMWYEQSLLQFSPGLSHAANRSTGLKLAQTLQLPFAEFRPAFNIEANTLYTQTNVQKHTDTTNFTFTFPFTIKKHTFILDWNKKTEAEKANFSTSNYQEDASEYFVSVPHQQWILNQPVFYDLFNPQLGDTLTKASQPGNYLYGATLSYSSTYKFTWQRPLFASLADLYIPIKFNTALSRDIKSSGLTTSDIYQTDTRLNFSALNSFGSFSNKPLFTWYEQDEIVQSYGLVMKFSRDKPLPFYTLFSLNNRIMLFISEQDYVKNDWQFQIQAPDNWNLLAGLSWERKGKTSLFTSAWQAIFPDTDFNQLKIKRVSNLEYSIEQKPLTRQLVKLGHSLIILPNKNATITTTINGEFSHKQNEAFTLGMSLYVGGKLSY